jgi:hypothetical protein
MTKVNRASFSNLWDRRSGGTSESGASDIMWCSVELDRFRKLDSPCCTCGRWTESLLRALPGAHQLRLRVGSASPSGLRQLLRWGLKEAHPRVERSDMQFGRSAWGDRDGSGKGGGGGIRTHGGLATTTVFETVRFVRSRTPPSGLFCFLHSQVPIWIPNLLGSSD